MIVISHRGNVRGPEPERENRIDFVEEAMRHFHVEVDVWYCGGLFLGHDAPETPVTIDWLLDDRLWCHAKNLAALNMLLSHDAHCFFHQNDDATLTSRGFLWTFPGKELFDLSVCVLPEKTGQTPKNFVCTDFPSRYFSLDN